jgi:glycosyltransferase involved in cell wall biosynthesis
LKTTPKKIAFLGIKGLPSKAGADRVVEAIVNNLSRTYDISVYCNRFFSNDYGRDDVRLIKLPCLKGKHLTPLSLFLFSALHALLFGNFDLIHVHNTDAGFIVPLLRLRYKVMATSHGYPYRRDKWNKFTKSLLKASEILFARFSNEMTCVSKTIALELTAKYNRKFRFIPNGIDDPVVAEVHSLLSKLGLQKNEYICFAAGRMDPTKGCHTLLEASRYLAHKNAIAIIGDFSHKPEYSRKLRKMSDGRARFIPFIADKPTLFGLIKNAKLFVFPSTVEAMSMMLLEVAALNVPIVCSDIRENIDILEAHSTYFRSGDPRDLAQKIENSLNNYGRTIEIAGEAREWVIKHNDWRTISAEYRGLYETFFKAEKV